MLIFPKFIVKVSDRVKAELNSYCLVISDILKLLSRRLVFIILRACAAMSGVINAVRGYFLCSVCAAQTIIG